MLEKSKIKYPTMEERKRDAQKPMYIIHIQT